MQRRRFFKSLTFASFQAAVMKSVGVASPTDLQPQMQYSVEVGSARLVMEISRLDHIPSYYFSTFEEAEQRRREICLELWQKLTYCSKEMEQYLKDGLAQTEIPNWASGGFEPQIKFNTLGSVHYLRSTSAPPKPNSTIAYPFYISQVFTTQEEKKIQYNHSSILKKFNEIAQKLPHACEIEECPQGCNKLICYVKKLTTDDIPVLEQLVKKLYVVREMTGDTA